MFVRKILKVSALALVTLIVCCVLILFLFDFGHFKPQIERAVSDATGRQFQIHGNLEFKALPKPTLLIENASLASPEWSNTPQMLEIGKAYAQISFWSLLFPPIVVYDFHLHDAKALVESNSEGSLNWDLMQPANKPKEKATPKNNQSNSLRNLLDIHAAAISNIQVTYRKAGSDDIDLSLAKLSIHQNELNITHVEGDANLQNIPISIDGDISNNHTELTTKIGEVSISSKYDYPDSAVNFKASISTLSKFGKLLKIKDLPAENLALEGNVSIEDGNIKLDGIKAALSNVQIFLDGKISGSDGNASVSAKISGDKLSTLKPDLPDIPFALQSEIFSNINSGNTVALKPFSLIIGESTLTGSANFISGDIPTLALKVQSEKLDLSPFITPSDPSKEEPKNQQEPEQDSSGSRYVFDDTPIPFDLLQSINAEIDADIAQVIASHSRINALKADLNLNKGVLKFYSRFSGEQSGKYESNIQITHSGDHSRLEIKTKAEALKLGLLSGDKVPLQQAPATSVTLNLKADGGTARSLVSSLNGTVLVHQGAGKVSNELMQRFSGDIVNQLLNALNPFAKNEPFSLWDCSIFAINFESGLGKVDGFLLQSEKLVVVGGGEIDLNEEVLDFEFNTKPRKGVGVSADMFVTPFVKLTGTLANPHVGLNKQGILISGGAAVLTGGMSFLYKGLMDRASAEGDQCERVLSAVQKSTAH